MIMHAVKFLALTPKQFLCEQFRTVPNSSCTMDYIKYMNLIILTAKSELHVHMTISRIIIKLKRTRISTYLSLSKQV